MTMASFTNDKDDSDEYKVQYASYTCDDAIDQLTKDVNNLTLSSQDPKDGQKAAPGRRMQTSVLSAANETLPITYQLMVLINQAKANGARGRIARAGFGHHDFAARGSHQIARGGYFQTREAGALGVAKYPILATASTELSARSYKALANELRVLSHPPLMDHGNIVKMNTIGWTRLDPSGTAWMPMIFLELAELGTLTKYLSEKRLEVDSKLRIAQDVGCGLQALHACGIMHGDLKLDNVLMFKGNDGKVRAKLSDFGCSYIAKGNEDKEATVEISAGTRPWHSPELNKQVLIYWLPNVDTYSFGLLVWSVFLNGRDPFEGLEEGDIDRRKAQDLIISDASLSLEDEYNKNMLLRGALSSDDRIHLYMRGVAMPKRCFRHTMSSLIQNRDLDAAMDSLSFEKIYGTVGSTKPTLDESRLTLSSVAVEFRLLFDIPRTARTMFFRSLQQVAANDAISRETRANAYLQLCYANINSFGTVEDFPEAIQCLKAAAGLGSAVAASIFRPLMLATGHTFDTALKNDLKRWLAKAVEDGSLLARKELRFLDDLTMLRKAEEPCRLFMGAKMPIAEGVADADHIETMFLPTNLGLMRVVLGAGRHPVLDGLGSMTKFMSPSMNTYLHAGAALGVDPDHFRNVIFLVDTETINAQDDVGNTALHLAVRFGNVEISQILLEHGASASLANKRGETPWHWFISLEEEDSDFLAELMMDYVDGLDSFAAARNSEDNQYSVAHGGTPLHWAVDMRLCGMATTLLNCGADPLIEYQGVSSIDLAIQMNAVELLELFLESAAEAGLNALPLQSLTDLTSMQHVAKREPADENEKPPDTLLIHAAGIRPLHERLIYSGLDWRANTISTLGILHEYDYLPSWCEENGQARLEALRLLSFANANATGPEMMEMMIDTTGVFPGGPGGGVSSTNEDAATFWAAALKAILQTSVPDMVHFAIDNVREYSPSSCLDNAEALLHGYCASLSADVSVVESILKDCSCVDCTDEDERTPLMNAVRERNFEIATYLLERGADVGRSWVQDGERMYILYEYVVNNIDVDVVPLKYLLEPMHPFPHKTPPFLIGPDSKATVLHQACKDGNPVIVDYLLSKFASKDQLNQPCEGGFTALHHAVYNGHADLVMKLCQAGADANARSGTSGMVNRERSRPLDLCFRWATQSEDFLAFKFGLERTREDIFLGRLRIADFLVRRHRARRADRFLMHRSVALKFALGAAQDGMTRLLAEVLRIVSREMDAAHKDVDYPLLLTNLLWVAALRGHIGATRLLLNLGADIKQRSAKGLSLLHVVSWLGKAELVYVLVKNGGADIDAEDAEGETVGSYSIKSKDLATIRMVKSLGGYFTLPRASVERIAGFPMDFNPRFIVKLNGEPSDDEISDKRSGAGGSDGDSQ
ncbi:hypothetical protein FSOLCH5_003693 [Fusarium solani]